MRKQVAAQVTDPVQARVAVLERVKSRKPPDQVRSYPNLNGGEPFVARTPSDSDRLPPKDLGAWVDDRILATFGGRVRLAPAEQVAFEILEAFRTGDPGAVRKAVAAAGSGIDAHLRYLVSGVLQEWKARAPSFALDVASAAMLEARRLGWDVRPRRQRRGPESLSQVPGERVA